MAESVSTAARAEARWSRSRLFAQHELKLLNSALIVYLLFGAFVFDWLGEFQEQIPRLERLKKDKSSAKEANASVGLAELRLRSVQRMWNITNRLNILYESNWTSLVLDELVEFERRLLDELAEQALKGEQESLFEEEEKEKDKNEKSTKSEKRSNKSRLRSIKKSLIHSLATITTIGSPIGTPQSQTAKLATILYGLLGMPLLFYTISQTGRQLANSTLNCLLTIRHYCFALPIHYLCCSCNPFICLRLLTWCCCCCCCSYLCCLAGKDKTKCCDSSRRPRLRLRPKVGRKCGSSHSGGATELGLRQQPAAAYVIGSGLDHRNQQQKTVRFSSNSAESLSPNEANETFGGDTGESYYTASLFCTSLSLLAVYLVVGAYVYSQNQSVSLLDGLFVCYSMLSASKLPDQIGGQSSSESPKGDPLSLYAALKVNTTQVLDGHQVRGSNQAGKELEGLDVFAWQALYLLCGLQLVAMCGHFARLCFSGDQQFGANKGLMGEPDNWNAPIEDQLMMSKSGCNGHIGSLIGSLDTAAAVGGVGAANAANATTMSIAPFPVQLKSTNQLPYVIPTSMAHSALDLSSQQQQVDLAELYVVNQNAAPQSEICYGIQPQQQQQQTSDVSFASDRSTDRGSLCLHHQAQLSSSSPSYYDHQQTNVQVFRPIQQPQTLNNLYPNSASISRRLDRDDDEEENDDDEQEGEKEMQRMLRNCLDGNNLHAISSSIQNLSRHKNQLQIGLGSLNRNPTSNSVRLRHSAALLNGDDQECSLNSANTGSSASSGRTIKLANQKLPNGIGFILTDEP